MHPEPDASLASRFDAFLLDLDGVVFRGRTVVAPAPEAIKWLRARAPVRFVTNNASRTPEQVAHHLRGLGVAADPGEVSTAAQAAVGLLAQQMGPGDRRPVLVVGGDGLVEAVRAAGYTPVRTADAQPIAVIQGFATTIAWPDLAQACYALRRGIPWIAANLDATLPTEAGDAPGNGAFVAALVAATGRSPISAGKPAATILQVALTGVGAAAPLMVGDRLDTDVGAAVAAGIASAVVLTGVTQPLDLCLARAEQRPDYIVGDVGGLRCGYAAPVVELTADRVVGRCGGWAVQVVDAELSVAGSGDAIDGLRTVVSAVWAATDAGRPIGSAAAGAAVEVVMGQR